MKFKKTAPIKIEPLVKVGEHKKLKRSLKVLKYSTIFALIALASYGAVTFYTTHDFRSPIIWQNPVPAKNTIIISPVAKKKIGMVGQAYAEEVKNPYDLKSPKGIAWQIIKDKFGIEQWEAFDKIVQKESGWNPYSINASSGACGIPQSLPCSKMACEKWDYECQINWMVDYIQNRYTNPNKALVFHFENGWY